MAKENYWSDCADMILDQSPATQWAWRWCQAVLGIWQVVNLLQQVDLGRAPGRFQLVGSPSRPLHLQLATHDWFSSAFLHHCIVKLSSLVSWPISGIR